MDLDMENEKILSFDGKREVKIFQVLPDPSIAEDFNGFPMTVGCDGIDVFFPAKWFGLEEAELFKLAKEDRQPCLENVKGGFLFSFNWMDNKFDLHEKLHSFKKHFLKTYNLPMIDSQ